MEGSTKSIFLPSTCRLHVFKFFIDRNLENLSFTSRQPHPATLEHLELGIPFEGNDYFSYPAFFRKLREDDFWSHLEPVHGYKESKLTSNTGLGMAMLGGT